MEAPRLQLHFEGVVLVECRVVACVGNKVDVCLQDAGTAKANAIPSKADKNANPSGLSVGCGNKRGK